MMRGRSHIGATTVAVLALVVAGCGSSSSEDGTNTTTAAAPATTTGTSETTAPPETTTTAGPNFEGQTLIVTSYGGTWEEQMRNNVIPGFEEATGATVELFIGGSADFAAQMEVAGADDPPFDVVIANETFMAGFRQDGYFAPITTDLVANLDDVEPALRGTPGQETRVLALFNPIGIAYNPDQATEPPTSWLDLDGSGTDGRVGIYNVGSTPGPMLDLTLAQITTGDFKNWQDGLDALESFCPLEEYGTVGDINTAFTQGDIALAIHDLGSVARLEAEGVPLEWVAPVEGVNAYDQNINVTAGSAQIDLAYAWVDHFLSEEIQRSWLVDYSYLPTNINVAVEGPLAPMLGDREITDVASKILQFDWIWFNSGPRDDLADAWNRQISGGSC